jgi:hypothetical protein
MFQRTSPGEESRPLSSILKALKKLEEEHPSPGDDIPWPRKLGPARIIRRWEIHSGRIAMILWASLGSILLAATGWFILYARQPIAANVAPRAVIPESVPANTAPLPEFLRKPQQPVQASKAKPSPTPAVRKPVRQAALGTAKQRSLPTPQTNTAKTTPKHRAEQQKLKAVGVPEGLTLQAISWSRQASERIAVINGQIIREGNAIEGFTIVRIEPDRVFVSKGGGTLALAFDLKRSRP